MKEIKAVTQIKPLDSGMAELHIRYAAGSEETLVCSQALLVRLAVEIDQALATAAKELRPSAQQRFQLLVEKTTGMVLLRVPGQSSADTTIDIRIPAEIAKQLGPLMVQAADQLSGPHREH